MVLDNDDLRLAQRTGRVYRLFDDVGTTDVERVIVMMGSGAGAVEETIEHLLTQGEKIGLLKARLYRPFAIEGFASALERQTLIVHCGVTQKRVALYGTITAAPSIESLLMAANALFAWSRENVVILGWS
jgi:pyruvate/2-oxoacid:ferredoxin oxidoreductase alpha subunit